MFAYVVKHIITSQIIIYTIRCLLGFLIGYFLMMQFPKFELFWTLLSIILVISPEGKDSQKLTIDRVRSNFIGSIVGLLCHLIYSTNLYVLIGGIITTVIICYLFKVMNMSRVAIVAFLIVMLQSHTLDQSIAPIFRFLTVAGGCLIGLTITVSTSIVIKKLRKHYNINSLSKI